MAASSASASSWPPIQRVTSRLGEAERRVRHARGAAETAHAVAVVPSPHVISPPGRTSGALSSPAVMAVIVSVETSHMPSSTRSPSRPGKSGSNRLSDAVSAHRGNFVGARLAVYHHEVGNPGWIRCGELVEVAFARRDLAGEIEGPLALIGTHADVEVERPRARHLFAQEHPSDRPSVRRTNSPQRWP